MSKTEESYGELFVGFDTGEKSIVPITKKTSLSLYEIVGRFENPLFNLKNRNAVLYVAASFDEAFKAAEKIGLKKVVKAVRMPLMEMPIPCKIIDINTREYIN